MQPLTACPDAAALRQFLEGQTSDVESAHLEKHLAGCPQCLQSLGAQAGDDELIRAIRNQGEKAPLQKPQWEALLQKIRQRRTSAALMNTGPLFMTGTEPSLMSENPNDMTHCLAPAQAPGEMGRLGGYRVLRILGSGGMGTVYEAEDIALRRRVALKTMKPSAASQQPGARERFLREARAAAALNHDHIVPIYQVGEDRNVPYLAMPMLLGEMLEDRLKRLGRLPVAEALRIGRETAEGLAAAHDHGIIHRDIKPGNIWLEAPNNRVKIVDFGLASCSEGDVQLTTPGTVLGTPAYMAPEQAGGPIDHRADLFSLGCVLYRMTTGRLPFPGASTMEILRNIAIQQPRSPRELNPEISLPLEQFLLRLLAKERDQRPVSAAVTAKVLQTLEQQHAASLQVSPAKPPAARIQVGPPPVAKFAPVPAQRATPQIRATPPPVGRAPTPDLNATTLDVAIRSNLNAASRPVASGAGASQSLKLAALPAWFKSLSPRHKVFLVSGVGGGLAVCLVGLILVLVLTLRGGPRSSPGGQPNSPDDSGAVAKLPPPKFVPSPGHREVKIPVGEALNPNSIVTRPATIKGLDTWDLISDHINNMEVTSLSFTRDGRLDLAHTHWDFEKGAVVPAPFGGAYSAISPDLAVCARSGSQAVSLYEKDKPDLIVRTLLTPGVTSVNWSNDGQDIATYGVEGIRVWNPNKARERSSWTDMPAAPASGLIGGFVWLPDDQSLLAWRGGDFSVEQIEADSGKVLQKIAVERLSSVYLQPQGKVFATAGFGDLKIRIYDLAGAKLLYTFPDACTATPAWSSNGKMLAFGVGAVIQVWGSDTWTDPKLLLTLDKPRQRSKAVGFAPHGETLFSYDADGKLRLWEVKSGPYFGQHRGTIVFLESGHWLAVTPEGDYRASSGAEEAGLFRFQVLEPKATFDLSPRAFADKYGWTNDPKKPLEALR